MTTRKTSRLPMIIIPLICFAVGALSVMLNLPDRFGLIGQATPTDSPSSTNQKTLLVLGVDELGNMPPRLLSIWLVSFRFPGREIRLFGIPTDYSTGSNPSPISSSFNWTQDTGVDDEFVNRMKELSPWKIDAIVVLDEIGFARLVDYMDGIILGENYMDGTTVITALRVFYDDPVISLEAQTKVLRAMLERVAVVGDTPDLTSLFELIPQHAYTSEPPSLMATTFGLLMPLYQDNIQILQWTDLQLERSPPQRTDGVN